MKTKEMAFTAPKRQNQIQKALYQNQEKYVWYTQVFSVVIHCDWTKYTGKLLFFSFEFETHSAFQTEHGEEGS